MAEEKKDRAFFKVWEEPDGTVKLNVQGMTNDLIDIIVSAMRNDEGVKELIQLAVLADLTDKEGKDE
jgi:predicted DNA-binding ArsR family transcriptional regulator